MAFDDEYSATFEHLGTELFLEVKRNQANLTVNPYGDDEQTINFDRAECKFLASAFAQAAAMLEQYYAEKEREGL